MEDIRKEVVLRLYDAARVALIPTTEDITASEVFSAGMTLAGAIIDAALQLGVAPAILRDAVLDLWKRIPVEEVH